MGPTVIEDRKDEAWVYAGCVDLTDMGSAPCDTADEIYLGRDTRHSISLLLPPGSALGHTPRDGECRRNIGKELV